MNSMNITDVTSDIDSIIGLIAVMGTIVIGLIVIITGAIKKRI